MQPNFSTIIHLRDFIDTMAEDLSLSSERGAAQCEMHEVELSLRADWSRPESHKSLLQMGRMELGLVDDWLSPQSQWILGTHGEASTL